MSRRFGPGGGKVGTAGLAQQPKLNLAAILAAGGELAPGPSVITWGLRTAEFPMYPLQSSMMIDPDPPRETNVSLSGVGFETLLEGRMEVKVRARWILDDWDLRWQLEDWWQWAKQGNAFTFAYDAARTVQTVITADAAAGTSALSLSATTGVTVGRHYALTDGPYRQVVKVSSIGGPIGIEGTLDNEFLSGATFWDLLYFEGRVLDNQAREPFRDIRYGINRSPEEPRYEFDLDFTALP